MHKIINIKHPQQQVSFAQAVRQGLGRDQGLFFPESFTPCTDIESLLTTSSHERSVRLLSPYVADSLDENQLADIIERAFTFAAPLARVNPNTYCLELFHGPTLAFKDFGARFMANCLSTLAGDEKITILTATSGDTGAAVAHAFYGLDNIDVVILYPKGKISQLQEKMFTTLGGNIRTLAVEGAFDDCQALVKQAFDDTELVRKVGLNSANSINLSRLLAQVTYYFDALAQLDAEQRQNTVICVPSGNFGNLTAGIVAKILGAPIKRFVAATNINDTVPRYLHTNQWAPNPTIATLSNAMDVSKPNNWPRIEYLMQTGQFARDHLSATAVDEAETEQTLREIYAQGYLSEPHAAVAYRALQSSLKEDEVGIFLGTAHPAKFKSAVDNILDQDIELPRALAECVDKPILSEIIPAEFDALKQILWRS